MILYWMSSTARALSRTPSVWSKRFAAGTLSTACADPAARSVAIIAAKAVIFISLLLLVVSS
jgi:hypothetical protein